MRSLAFHPPPRLGLGWQLQCCKKVRKELSTGARLVQCQQATSRLIGFQPAGLDKSHPPQMMRSAAEHWRPLEPPAGEARPEAAEGQELVLYHSLTHSLDREQIRSLITACELVWSETEHQETLTETSDCRRAGQDTGRELAHFQARALVCLFCFHPPPTRHSRKLIA